MTDLKEYTTVTNVTFITHHDWLGFYIPMPTENVEQVLHDTHNEIASLKLSLQAIRSMVEHERAH